MFLGARRSTSVVDENKAAVLRSAESKSAARPERRVRARASSAREVIGSKSASEGIGPDSVFRSSSASNPDTDPVYSVGCSGADTQRLVLLGLDPGLVILNAEANQ